MLNKPVSVTRLVNKKSSLAPYDTSALFACCSCFPTFSIQMQPDTSSPAFSPGWRTPASHSRTHAPISDDLWKVGFAHSPRETSTATARGWIHSYRKMTVFISKPDPISGNHQSILQRCRWPNSLKKKRVKIQLANSISHDLQPFKINTILMVAVWEVALHNLDQSFPSRNPKKKSVCFCSNADTRHLVWTRLSDCF